MDNTYLFLNTSTSVYYSTKNKQYYIADELQETQDGIDLISQASKAAYKLFSTEISKYISHFKNIAVLTAAGTSMDNGTHSGKTRDGLWNECFDNINKIISKLQSEASISATDLSNCQMLCQTHNRAKGNR